MCLQNTSKAYEVYVFVIIFAMIYIFIVLMYLQNLNLSAIEQIMCHCIHWILWFTHGHGAIEMRHECSNVCIS